MQPFLVRPNTAVNKPKNDAQTFSRLFISTGGFSLDRPLIHRKYGFCRHSHSQANTPQMNERDGIKLAIFFSIQQKSEINESLWTRCVNLFRSSHHSFFFVWERERWKIKLVNDRKLWPITASNRIHSKHPNSSVSIANFCFDTRTICTRKRRQWHWHWHWFEYTHTPYTWIQTKSHDPKMYTSICLQP